MIFYIDVVTNDSKMEKILINELEENGISKYKFKKNYTTLQQIKQKILSNHKDELEWLEIENIGTKYIIRYEPRIINKEKEKTPLRHIVASKDAIISDIKVSSGQIIKDINSYVKKGQIIVSGYIDLNGNIKDTVSATGTVYGETWYKVEITYPYKYYQSTITGNNKNIFIIKFLNKEIELFNFKKYKSKKVFNNILLKNNILPISFGIQKQMEIEEIKENNTENEAIDKAIKLSKEKIEKYLRNKGESEEKIENSLKKGEYIKDYKILNKIKNKDSITLNLFFSVIENITDYEEIEKFNEETE